MKRFIVTSMLILSAFLLKQSFAQTHSEWVSYKGDYVMIPDSYFDPSFPSHSISERNFSDSDYKAYLSMHLFPLPEEGDYEKRLEYWLLNNKNIFPQYLPTGNEQTDSVRFLSARAFWMQKNEKLMSVLSQKSNPSGLSDSDFQMLFNSFPRMENTGNAQLDRDLYNEAVLEWIRLYSMEKYLIIEPLVRESDDLLKLNEGK